MLGPLRGIVKLVKEHEENVFFFNSISYYGLLALTIANFQFFGVYMIMGLSFNQNYFQYLSMAGLLLFMTSLIVGKFAKVIFV
jgi:hypothetical protein